MKNSEELDDPRCEKYSVHCLQRLLYDTHRTLRTLLEDRHRNLDKDDA